VAVANVILNKSRPVEVQRLVNLTIPMKKILFAFAIIALFSPAVAPQARADVSIDYFYDNLSGGSWIDVEGYGYCWQPDLAVNDSNWRPYTDGYWAYTDAGWTWVSYEDFGWATYHYGRWARLADYGWVWVPGADLEWGPAWVSWRTGGDYIGWAPLPPRGVEVVYEGRPIGPQVDIEFDIGPEYYSFCDVRYIGEPVLRGRIIDYRQNVTYINQTVNVTNIRVENNVVVNYGPDVNFINQHSSRPIQRLHLERQQNVDFVAAAKSGGANKVQGNSLIVAAPMKLTKPTKQIAPPTIKTKVSQPKFEKGWAGVDSNTQTQMKQKIRTENPKNIPPMTKAAVQAGAGATGQTGVGASPSTTPFQVEKGKGRGKHGEQIQPGVTGTPVGSPATGTSPAIAPEYGKHKGKHGEQLGGAPPVTGPTTAPESTTIPGGKHKGQFERGVASPSPVVPEATQAPIKQKGQLEHGNLGPNPVGPNGENVNEPQGKHRRVEPTVTPGGSQGPQNQTAPYSETRGGGKHGDGGVTAPPAAGTSTGPATSPVERKHEGKQKGQPTTSPSPAPQ
jgi:hypothetical protein